MSWRERPKVLNLTDIAKLLQKLNSDMEQIPVRGRLRFVKAIKQGGHGHFEISYGATPTVFATTADISDPQPLLVDHWYDSSDDDTYSVDAYEETRDVIFLIDPKTKERVILAEYEDRGFRPKLEVSKIRASFFRLDATGPDLSGALTPFWPTLLERELVIGLYPPDLS